MIFKKSKNLNILVTGHKGLIGNYLFTGLKEKNFNVFGVDKGFKSSEKEVSFDLSKSFDLKNLNDEKAYNLIQDADIIIHCAAVVGVDNHITKTDSFITNWKIDKNLLENLRENQTFIYFSSSEVYGCSNGFLTPSSSLKFSSKKRSNYALEKLFVERYIQEKHKKSVILRPFNIVGNHKTQKKGVFAEFYKKAKENKDIIIYQDPNGNFSSRVFLSIEDLFKVILGICKTPEKFENKIFNVNNNPNQSISIVQLAEKFKETLNSSSNIVFKEARENDSLILQRTPDYPEIFELLKIKKLKTLKEIFNDFII